MSSSLPPTPELDKMHAARPATQRVGEFLEWLGEQGLHICQYVDEEPERCGRCGHALAAHHCDTDDDGGPWCGICLDTKPWSKAHHAFTVHELIDGHWVPIGGSIERMLARWQGIDLDAVEAERRSLLEVLS